MRTYQPTYRRGGEQHTSPTWHVRFKDHRNVWQRVPAFTDRAMSEELGRKIDKLVATIANHERPTGDQARWLEVLRPDIRDRLAKWGLVDDRMASASKPLSAHLDDFHASLIAKGNTSAHADLVTVRARRVVDACRFKLWLDVNAAAVERVLSDYRADTAERRGISRQTSNFYLQAVKQFARWMVANERASESPLAHLKALNVRTDRRHDRRAMTADELQRLVTATYNGPTREGRRLTSNAGKPTWSMTGPERAALYLTSMVTGLRSSELASLTRSSFALDGDSPTITVKAGYAKGKREDTLPLDRQDAEQLEPILIGKAPAARVFHMPPKHNVVKLILRPDLEAARAAWIAEAASAAEAVEREQSDYLRYEDSAGLFADFHALRHSFITNLASPSVHPRTAQSLARHSDINLTMSRYTHVYRQQEQDAIATLPRIELDAPDRSEQRRRLTHA